MKKIFILTMLALALSVQVEAQIENLEGVKWQRVERDSLPESVDSLLTDVFLRNAQPTDDRYRVVTNRFWHNWWVSADAGVHTFQGDWSDNGKFNETLSPNFTVGLGKWFTPGFGIKAQFGMGTSRGFTEIWTPYAMGSENSPMLKEDGTPYWKLKTKWWDINANVVLNLSRILHAWEGYGTDDRFNQFFLTLGIGGVHHYDKALKYGAWEDPYGGPKNEWYGNVELQYSRFFHKNKAWSLDVKLRGRFYETHFDLSPIANRRWDFNAGVSIGATYYIKQRGWERCVPCNEVNYFINVPVPEPKPEPIPVPVVQDCPENRMFTFFIFYPNNYSGRNDAPVVKGAKVNAMDYLAGGVFTQKRFQDELAVAERLKSGAALNSLKTEDIPSEKATFISNLTGVARGYEISSRPISLSMHRDSLRVFEELTGYYYAPIYEKDKTWCYRVDDETRTQTLLLAENYKESTSYALNAHKGLATIKEHLPISSDSELYSFADVYAALNGYEGYISRYADKQSVEEIKEILANGTILHVQAEGIATSQDNFTGTDAKLVGMSRNTTLANLRALSAIEWLKQSGKFEGVSPDKFSINVLSEPIEPMQNSSTRNLHAKLYRCAKVTILYSIKK